MQQLSPEQLEELKQRVSAQGSAVKDAKTVRALHLLRFRNSRSRQCMPFDAHQHRGRSLRQDWGAVGKLS